LDGSGQVVELDRFHLDSATGRRSDRPDQHFRADTDRFGIFEDTRPKTKS
jgi:hypothetical protein